VVDLRSPGSPWRSWPTPYTSWILPRPWRAASPALNAFLANKWYPRRINDRNFRQGQPQLARQVLELTPRWWTGWSNLTGLLTTRSGEGLKYFSRNQGSSSEREPSPTLYCALIVFGGRDLALVCCSASFSRPAATVLCRNRNLGELKARPGISTSGPELLPRRSVPADLRCSRRTWLVLRRRSRGAFPWSQPSRSLIADRGRGC